LGGGAKNAIEKSWGDEGEEGVTMIAGNADFSVAKGNERSLYYKIRQTQMTIDLHT
jgi:hypothetical protein